MCQLYFADAPKTNGIKVAPELLTFGRQESKGLGGASLAALGVEVGMVPSWSDVCGGITGLQGELPFAGSRTWRRIADLDGPPYL